jgi:hypothetical protein
MLSAQTSKKNFRMHEELKATWRDLLGNRENI